MPARKSRFIIVSEKNQARVIDVVQSLIQRRNSYFLKQILFRLHPTDLAYLWDLFEHHEKEFLLSILETQESADLLSELGVEHRSAIFKTKSTD